VLSRVQVAISECERAGKPWRAGRVAIAWSAIRLADGAAIKSGSQSKCFGCEDEIQEARRVHK